MNDEIAVRVLNRCAHAAEQLQATLDRQVSLLAISVDRYAIDVLHCEPRQTIFSDSAVEESGDVRVVERGENLPLVHEAANEALVPRAPRRQKFDSYLSLVLIVGALGEVYGSHAAATDLVENAVGSDLSTICRSIGVEGETSEEGRRKFRCRGLEESVRFGISQYSGRSGAHIVISGARTFDMCYALVGFELESLVENFEDLPPPGSGSSRRRVLPDTDSVQNARRSGAAQTASAFAYIPLAT